ncbi:neurofilament light polypeptide-like [Bolinopsis microptera]|uniref:neurofilament light polypeptide-like n=1 Tax=Bolinopsis microptera TaxID=2820187 RepID=UPI003078EFD2
MDFKLLLLLGLMVCVVFTVESGDGDKDTEEGGEDTEGDGEEEGEGDGEEEGEGDGEEEGEGDGEEEGEGDGEEEGEGDGALAMSAVMLPLAAALYQLA